MEIEQSMLGTDKVQVMEGKLLAGQPVLLTLTMESLKPSTIC